MHITVLLNARLTDGGILQTKWDIQVPISHVVKCWNCYFLGISTGSLEDVEHQGSCGCPLSLNSRECSPYNTLHTLKEQNSSHLSSSQHYSLCRALEHVFCLNELILSFEMNKFTHVDPHQWNQLHKEVKRGSFLQWQEPTCWLATLG